MADNRVITFHCFPLMHLFFFSSDVIQGEELRPRTHRGFLKKASLSTNPRNDLFRCDHILYITQTDAHILYTQTDDIIDIWAHCYRLFIEVIDRHAPLKKKLVRGNTVSWITPKIFRLKTQEIVCIENLLRTKRLKIGRPTGNNRTLFHL